MAFFESVVRGQLRNRGRLADASRSDEGDDAPGAASDFNRTGDPDIGLQQLSKSVAGVATIRRYEIWLAAEVVD